MRLLLTGSAGWLGRHLARRLVAAGHKVVGLDVVAGECTHVVGSVADRDLIDRTIACHGIEAILHGAALHKPDIARHPRQAFVDVNVTGTLNLLEAAIAAGHDRFVFTSTTSLMVSDDVRAGADSAGAWWIDEDFGPLAPRNIYGVTKLAAEQLCRLAHRDSGMAVLILRTSRFFPEDDDTHTVPSGPNLKAIELLHRRLTVEDAAEAHLAAIESAPQIGCDTFIVSAPPSFAREEAAALAHDAAFVIQRHYPQAPALFARHGWVLPATIERVYDPGRAERILGWRAKTDFAAVLAALEQGAPLPFAHDPSYVSPTVARKPNPCMN